MIFCYFHSLNVIVLCKNIKLILVQISPPHRCALDQVAVQCRVHSRCTAPVFNSDYLSVSIALNPLPLPSKYASYQSVGLV